MRNRKRVTEGVWINKVVIGRHSISTHITRENTSRVLRSRNCISCVPKYPLQVYQLRPELSVPSMKSCVPRLIRILHQLHRKIWVYKMSNSWKVLTQFNCIVLYTQLYAHIQNCLMVSTTQLLYHVTV